MTNKSISIKGADKVYKNIKNLMKQMGGQYSIKVGIIGEKAKERHEGTNLNNATLGAVHEFGAEINHPGGQPYYFNSATGMTVFVSKNSFLGQYLITKGQVTKPHIINIPARPFLSSLLTKQAKDYIYNAAELSGDDFELDKLLAESAIERDSGFIENLANIVGAKALEMVQNEFSIGGYPDKWQNIKEASRKKRIGHIESPPLTDTGELRNSITAEVKKVK